MSKTSSSAISEPSEVATSTPLRGGVWVAPEGANTLYGDPVKAELSGGRYLKRTFNRSDTVFRSGDVADGFYMVLAGHVKLTLSDPVRGERVIAVCGAGDLFGAAACGGAPTQHAEAVSLQTGTLIVTLSCAELQEEAKKTPSMALLLVRSLAARVQTLEEEAEFASLPVQARLARTLLDLSKRLGREVEPGVYDLELALRQDEIASLAGATRMSATQALSAWRSIGVVTGTRGSYRVDAVRLAALMELLEDAAVN